MGFYGDTKEGEVVQDVVESKIIGVVESMIETRMRWKTVWAILKKYRVSHLTAHVSVIFFNLLGWYLCSKIHQMAEMASITAK